MRGQLGSSIGLSDTDQPMGSPSSSLAKLLWGGYLLGFDVVICTSLQFLR